MKYLLLLLIPSNIFGQSMNFTMSGMISNAPYWVNENNNEVTNVHFTFDNTVAGNASTNVDSTSLTVTIISTDESGTNLDIVLTRPSGCTIGSTTVNNDHVQIIKDGVVISTNSTVTFIEGTSSNLVMRFSNAGFYGDDAGPVNCNSGMLTYSY